MLSELHGFVVVSVPNAGLEELRDFEEVEELVVVFEEEGSLPTIRLGLFRGGCEGVTFCFEGGYGVEEGV